jgi:hypothetical protein
MSGSQTLLQRADIAVFSSDYSLQLIIEIKTKKNASIEWASQYRHNLFVHNELPKSPYFMFVLPDQIFVWTNAIIDFDRKPDYQLETTAVLGTSLASELPSISQFGLALITRAWLYLLTMSDLSPRELEPHQQWLIESGLYQAIKRGSVASDTEL